MDIKELHSKATTSTDTFVHAIKEEDWVKQSTCTDWTVRDLLNHLVNENLWVTELLNGKTIAEVGSQFDGDVLGEDPISKWEETNTIANTAVQKLDDPEQVCHLSYADVPCSEYLSQRILDLTIHGWDVAKSTGQNDSLDQELVQFVYDMVCSHEKELRDSGMFGERIDVADDVDLQTKLLALLGRKR